MESVLRRFDKREFYEIAHGAVGLRVIEVAHEDKSIECFLVLYAVALANYSEYLRQALLSSLLRTFVRSSGG